jgi:anti-sigma regulatory factor (Ser/Thr protein kinase)
VSRNLQPLGGIKIPKDRASFPYEACSAREARSFVVTFAATWFTGEYLDDIEMAVGEAVANAVEHGRSDGEFIFVDCTYRDGKLTVDVDGGLGFADSAQIAVKSPELGQVRGRGIWLMNKCMDSVEYYENGKHLRMTKRVSAALSNESMERDAQGRDFKSTSTTLP